jgi:LexA-binding, inner membrane-associated putative hydrolase
MGRLAFVAFVLGNSPDLDIIPGTLFPEYWRVFHRYYGHNAFSLILWIILGAWALELWVSKDFKGWYGRMLAALLVVSHVLFDAMGDFHRSGLRMGVPLLWPFSDWEFNLPIRLFKEYSLKTGVNPLAGHILSTSFWTEAVFAEVFYGAMIVVVWIMGYRAFTVVRKVFSRPLPIQKIEEIDLPG